MNEASLLAAFEAETDRLTDLVDGLREEREHLKQLVREAVALLDGASPSTEDLALEADLRDWLKSAKAVMDFVPR